MRRARVPAALEERPGARAARAARPDRLETTGAREQVVAVGPARLALAGLVGRPGREVHRDS